jgi:beta-galactosidase
VSERLARLRLLLQCAAVSTLVIACSPNSATIFDELRSSPRSRELFSDDWRFIKDDPLTASGLTYEDTKAWTLPTGNPFIADPAARHERPRGNPGQGVVYAAADFDDSGWRTVRLPHDYAIEGPFTDDVSANMGRLPATGVAWYRKTFELPIEDAGKSIFVDFDGAMSYSLVWVNGELVGGWPYGYSSWRLDITPYVELGSENVIAVRLDNPVPAGTIWSQGSSRWYPGAGIYRDVWLVKTEPVRVAQWGTFVKTSIVTDDEASVELDVTIDNETDQPVSAGIATYIFEVDTDGNRGDRPVAALEVTDLEIEAHASATFAASGTLDDSKLWGPPPTQTPNLYDAVTEVTVAGETVDLYSTRFGVRRFEYSPDEGLLVNDEPVKIQGVNLHHDVGALGAVANPRAKERQLEILADIGVNAIRTAHNPEAPVFYDLADRFGLLVMDEAFDVWWTQKAELDHHLFFDEWHEQDLRSMIRRDRNHPSVFIWSIGNEVVEQRAGDVYQAALAIRAIANDEDPTRPTVAGMNAADPGTAFADAMETIGLNYQGSGVRDAPPEYPDFHAAYPDRFIVGTETTDAYSSRGVYTFPVTGPDGEPASGSGGVTADGQVSSYDLYHASWSYVPDLEFEHQDRWNYVAGEFVWTGFDYLGEPDPHAGTGARSSYSGIVDLAGFPKDRFYLYQANWRRDLPMAHLLPHWNWPGREGEITPVHVYTTGDSAELYVNDRLVGRRDKGAYRYRLVFDDIVYEPGTVRVVAYLDGEAWAEASRETTGEPKAITLEADRAIIAGVRHGPRRRRGRPRGAGCEQPDPFRRRRRGRASRHGQRQPDGPNRVRLGHARRVQRARARDRRRPPGRIR